jgi:hypothetical protein
MVGRLREYTLDVDRDPADIGIEGILSIATVLPTQWLSHAEQWQEIGATHLAVSTIGAGFTSPQEHITALQQIRDVLGE